MKFPKVNVPLINEVLAYIKKFPDTYDQNAVANSVPVTKENKCGAIGCFGGWAVLLSMPLKKRHEYADDVTLNKAQKLLGLTPEEGNFLFGGASGDPVDDYNLIKRRLTHIRESRCVAEGKMRPPEMTHLDEFYEPLEYR
jgi:hypothetical protein